MTVLNCLQYILVCTGGSIVLLVYTGCSIVLLVYTGSSNDNDNDIENL